MNNLVTSYSRDQTYNSDRCLHDIHLKSAHYKRNKFMTITHSVGWNMWAQISRFINKPQHSGAAQISTVTLSWANSAIMFSMHNDFTNFNEFIRFSTIFDETVHLCPKAFPSMFSNRFYLRICRTYDFFLKIFLFVNFFALKSIYRLKKNESFCPRKIWISTTSSTYQPRFNSIYVYIYKCIRL